MKKLIDFLAAEVPRRSCLLLAVTLAFSLQPSALAITTPGAMDTTTLHFAPSGSPYSNFVWRSSAYTNDNVHGWMRTNMTLQRWEYFTNATVLMATNNFPTNVWHGTNGSFVATSYWAIASSPGVPTVGTNNAGNTNANPPPVTILPTAIYIGTNAPALAANQGSIYNQFDQTGTNFVAQYVKTSTTGSNGWVRATNNISVNFGVVGVATNALYAGVASNYTGRRIFGNLVHTPGTVGTLITSAPATATPFRVVAFGDSLMNNQMPYFYAYLQNQGRLLGYFVGQNDLFGDATYNNLDFTNWVNGEVTTFTTGYAVPDSGVTAYFGDTAEILYETGTGFGTMLVSNKIVGGSTYLSLTNFSTAAAATNLMKVTASLPYAGYWSLKIAASGGTCRLVGTTIYHHLQAGMLIYNFSQGGVGFSNFCLCYTNVLTQISTVLDPNLVVAQEIHSPYSGWIKNGGLVIGSAALQTNTDVILESANLTYGEVPSQLAGPQALAYSNNWILYDMHGLWNITGTNAIDWTNAVIEGYLTSDVTNPHPTPAGINAEIASLFWDTGMQNEWMQQNSPWPQVYIQSANNPVWTFFNPLTSAQGAYITTLAIGGGSYQVLNFVDTTATNSVGSLFVNGSAGTLAFNAPNGAAQFTVNYNTGEVTVTGDLVVNGNGGNGRGVYVTGGYPFIGNGSQVTNVFFNKLALPTNTAPSGITWGTTAPDYWVTNTLPNGSNVYVPIFRAH